MSDAARPVLKISREGIVLIKSFEGFRPRAIRREKGGWVIGYGHTLSAREGASVSEPDAELLLRYDLLPVETSVNQAGSAVLNQHQFDALVSFAFSVGVDRFQTSDVLGHLATGATGQAADALMGWPEPALPQTTLRRRAAERALFVADPDAPVAVSDLLVAPLENVEPVDPTGSAATAKDLSPTDPIDEATASAPDAVTPNDPRSAAVSALLGEVEDVVLPNFAPPPPVVSPVIDNDPAADTLPAAANDAVAGDETALDASEPLAIPPDATVNPDDESGATSVTTVDHEEAEAPQADAPAQTSEPTDAAAGSLGQSAVRFAPTGQRYSPYAAAMVGPLPFLQPAQEPAPEPQLAEPSPSALEQAETTIEIAVIDEPSAVETPVIEAPVVEAPVVATPIFASFAPAAEVEPLVLSAAEDAPAPAMTRQPWTIEERSEPLETNDGGLFGEDLSLTQGGAPVMRHSHIDFDAPASFDWSETGAFIIMGAVGLTAFGAAMAAFRLASEQSGGDQTVIIAWVLAVIGAACVGVSSFNLYRRWGLPGGDN